MRDSLMMQLIRSVCLRILLSQVKLVGAKSDLLYFIIELVSV